MLTLEKMIWESIVPFVAMFSMEGMTIALTITANVAMEYGMNQFVFVAYSNALSSLILIPYSCFFHKDRMKESFSLRLMSRFFLLGFTGITIGQNLAFTGLRYSSPIVVCAMGLLLPCFQFFLALFQGDSRFDLRRSICKVRIISIIVSFLGAVMVIFYKGPSIIPSSFSKPPLLNGGFPLFVSLSTSQQWILGCIFLACATFVFSVGNVVQVRTFSRLPDMMVIVTWYILLGTVQTAVVDLIAERDLSAWKLSLNLELAIIILTAFCGAFVRSKVQGWCMNRKGSMYVAMFKPCGIFWACLITLSLFGNSLHYGSVVGTVISGIGYYGMLWAAGREKEERTHQTDNLASSDDQLKAPLLQQQEDDHV